MHELRFTLLSDGSSDRALLPLLRMLLQEHCEEVALQSEWADLRRLREPPRGLGERVQEALRLYPCELLFVHRDAENQAPDDRRREIQAALAQVETNGSPPVVCVIPVRMQEAWLLVSESAIRRAAGNPNGSEPLDLPELSQLESEPDPKAVLHGALKQASGLRGVRRKRFAVHARVHRVADHIESLSSLRKLSAFQRLEEDLSEVLEDLPLSP